MKVAGSIALVTGANRVSASPLPRRFRGKSRSWRFTSHRMILGVTATSPLGALASLQRVEAFEVLRESNWS